MNVFGSFRSAFIRQIFTSVRGTSVLTGSEKSKVYDLASDKLEATYKRQICALESAIVKKREILESEYLESTGRVKESIAEALSELYQDTPDEEIDTIWPTPASQLNLADALLMIGDHRNASELMWSAASISVREYAKQHCDMHIKQFIHNDLTIFVRLIAPQLKAEWNVAESCHANFYNGGLSIEFLQEDYASVFRFCEEFPKQPLPTDAEKLKRLARMKRLLLKRKAEAEEKARKKEEESAK